MGKKYNNRIFASKMQYTQENIDALYKENVDKYIKQRVSVLRKEWKLANKDTGIEIPDKQHFIDIVLKDGAYNDFCFEEKERLHKSFEYINSFRNTIDDLNNLLPESHLMEKVGFQTEDDKKLSYFELINLSKDNTDIYKDILKSREESWNNHINTVKCNTELLEQIESDNQLQYDILERVLELRDIYNIPDTMSDIDIILKYGYDTNIDKALEISNRLLLLENQETHFVNYFTDDELNSKYSLKSVISKLYKRKIVSNSLLAKLLSPNISNNKVTVLDNSFTNNNSLKYVYRTRTLGEILLEIINPHNAGIDKTSRNQMYSTYYGYRPTKEDYCYWNGLQVFDIDLKEWIREYKGDIDFLKLSLFKELKQFPWLLWICKSSSGNGLHIYTKSAVPHHTYPNAKDNNEDTKYWYYVSYHTKQSIIHQALHQISLKHRNKIVFPKNDNNKFENQYLDNTVARITSGIKISYDDNVLVNENFEDMYIGLGLTHTLNGYNFEQDILSVLLRDGKSNKFIDIINSYQKSPEEQKQQKVIEQIDLSRYVKNKNISLDKIDSLPRHRINYYSRYNVCNTLANLYGVDGLEIAHIVLDSRRIGNENEINGIFACSISNLKPASKFGLELLKECNVVTKNTDEELDTIVTNYEKDRLRQILETTVNSAKNDKVYDINMGSGYLDNHREELIRLITNEKINVILSPASSGKTTLIKNLSKSGERILLVLPYISVINNKIVNDADIVENFDVYFGDKSMKELKFGRNAVSTFDKLSRANMEKISETFSMVVIDESHLLFTSQYRIDTTSSLLKKLKELYYYSNISETAAKLVLMTGTETGESFFFKNVGNVINTYRKNMNKTFEVLICDDNLDTVTRCAYKVSLLLKDGYRVLIPTNKGDIYSEKIMGMIHYLMERPVKYGYYKRSNSGQQIVEMINKHSTIGDYEIVFCTNYLSVGVDIIDIHKFAVVYYGNFSGYEIEQFNSRIRRTNIYSVYCLSTENIEKLYEEPELLLKITDDDKVRFIDDKVIAHAKQEFITSYDPILKEVSTPGFKVVNGRIEFVPEEYELINFENKYTEVNQHIMWIVKILHSYGYEIKISTDYDGLPLSTQKELKKIGIDSAKIERQRKHNDMIGTFKDLVNKNNYENEHGLEYHNVTAFIKEYIGKADIVVENRNLPDDVFVDIKFSIFASPERVEVRSMQALEKVLGNVIFLLKFYNEKSAIEFLMRYVSDEGIINQRAFQRALNFLRISKSVENNETSKPVINLAHKIYEYIDYFESNPELLVPYDKHKNQVEKWCYEYIDDLGISINTQYGFEKIRIQVEEILNDFAEKVVKREGVRFDYIKFNDYDSEEIKSKKTIDKVIKSMFEITNEMLDGTFVKMEKHFVKSENINLIQEF